MSMALVGASSLQACQSELVVTLSRQLQSELGQGRAFNCNSCLRTGEFIVLNAPIFFQLRSPRNGRRLDLCRHSASTEPGVASMGKELDYEESVPFSAQFRVSEDTSVGDGSGYAGKTATMHMRAELPTWENASVLDVQLQNDSQDNRPSGTNVGPESGYPRVEAPSAHSFTPGGSDPVLKCIADIPGNRRRGWWFDEGSTVQVSPDTRSISSATKEKTKELDPHRVYVGGLPFSFQGQELRKGLHQLFSNFGPVRNLEIAVFGHDNTYIQENGRHRGYAFVVMDDPEDAKAAITCLNGQLYWGRYLMVRQAFKKAEQPKVADRPCQLYVGNLNKTVNNRELRKIFKRYGHVIQTKVLKEYLTGKSRGFAFVTFAEEEEGQRAVEHLHGYVLGGSALTVNIAKDPKPLDF